MSSENVSKPYKQYKSDTEQLAAWLLETAKNKAKIKLKKDKSAEQSRYIMPLSSFTTFAEAIARLDVQVPRSIINVTKRAILLRKHVQFMYESELPASSKAEDDENNGHQHIISILEQVLEKLEEGGIDEGSTTRTEVEEKAINTKDSRSEILTANRFAALSLADYMDEYEAPKTSKPDAAATSPELTEIQIIDDVSNNPAQGTKDASPLDLSFETGWLAGLHVMISLSKLRKFISNTWLEYKINQLDLVSATMLTNVAIQHAERECSRLHKEFDFGTWWFPQHYYEWAYGHTIQEPIPMLPSLDQFADQTKAACLDLGDGSLYATSMVLQDLLTGGEPSCQPKLPSGPPSPVRLKHDSSVLRLPIRNHKEYIEAKGPLDRIWPYIQYLHTSEYSPSGEDVFTQAMKCMLKSKEGEERLPLWVPFAAQLHCDIVKILDTVSSKPFNDFRLIALRTKKILDNALSLFEDRGDKTCTSLLRVIDQSLSVDYQGHDQGNVQSDGPKWLEFLRSTPLLAGTITAFIGVEIEDAGRSLMNQINLVTPLALLNNLNKRLANVSLPDIDKVMELQGTERMFFGSIPSTFDETWEKVRLFRGYSIKSLKKEKQDKQLLEANEKRRGFKRGVASKLMSSYFSPDGFGLIDTMHVIYWQSTGAISCTKAGEYRIKVDAEDDMLDPYLFFKRNMMQEERNRMFDYFGMQGRMTELCDLLRKEFEMGDNFHAPYVVDELFKYVVSDDWLTKPRQRDNSPYLKRAAAVFKAFSEAKGGVACKELKAFCRNKDLL